MDPGIVVGDWASSSRLRHVVVAVTVSGDARVDIEDGIEAGGIGDTGKRTVSDARTPVETAVTERDGTTVAGKPECGRPEQVGQP